MVRFLLLPDNLPFAVALGLMLALTLLEVAATLLGLGFSSFHHDAPDLDHGIDHDLSADHDFDFLHWLGFGKLPVLALLIIFLTLFGSTGLIVQSVAQSATGRVLNGWLAAAIAIALTLPILSRCSNVVHRTLFRDDTTALSEDSFLGHQAIITLGETQRGKPSQAKFIDKFGQTHYVLVEPARDGDSFTTGDEVVLVRRNGAVYDVVSNDVDSLMSLSITD